MVINNLDLRVRVLSPNAVLTIDSVSYAVHIHNGFIVGWDTDNLGPQPTEQMLLDVPQAGIDALQLADAQKIARDKRWAAYRAQGGPDDLRMELMAKKDPGVDARVDAARQAIHDAIPIP